MPPASSSRPGLRLLAGRLRRVWRDRAGATSLELALVTVAFLTLLVGSMDLGRYYLVAHSIRTAASEAARAALLDTTMSDCDTPKAKVSALVPLLDPTALSVCVTQFPFVSGVNTITATVTYTFSAISPMLAALNGTITETTVIKY
jgi:Flp pilus assembly protein TadG